ncbi:12369_t:CDS:1 [Dentiscutata heterogama]|uniref:12369_t:CDS:1 n=1 Tax=Dentiscutata heterogama TaxID=1316150 RepID=A0ACA9KLZ6_9GLOM|nr:12369_t:CDS:1 [Dentiscutata heterogama]
MATSNVSASSLPNEIYLSIFTHLSKSNLLAASLVCHKWHISFISFLFSNLFIKSSRQLSLLNKYSLLKRHSHLILSLSLFKLHLSPQDKQLLLTTCKNLNKLTLIKCCNIDSDFLRDIIRNNKNSIEIFNIWGERSINNSRININSTEINDELLSPMIEFCGNLRELRICGAEITDSILIRLISSLDDPISPRNPSSSSVDNYNSGESNFNSSSSQDLLVNSLSSPILSHTYPHLHSLDFTECFNLTAFGIAELFSPDNLPSFHSLTLQHNPQNELDLEFFEFLADSFKSHSFKIIILNSKRFDEKNKKVLHTFARITKDLEVLGTKKDNVHVIKHEKEMDDSEILCSIGISSPFMYA